MMTLLVGLRARYLVTVSLTLLLSKSGSRVCAHKAKMSTEETGAAGKFSVALVTAPSMEVAQNLSRAIVQRKLAACVNIIPQVVSIYEWQGNIEESSECLMMIKTQTRHIPDLTSFVLSQHPYNVPEVISLEIADGNEAYLKWIEQATQK